MSGSGQGGKPDHQLLGKTAWGCGLERAVCRALRNVRLSGASGDGPPRVWMRKCPAASNGQLRPGERNSHARL